MDDVLDITQNKFYRWHEIDFPYFSTFQIQYEYADYHANPVKSTIFDNLFDEDLVGIGMQFLSRAIAGMIKDKNFGLYCGYRGCGKSSIVDLLYVYCTSSYALPWTLTRQ